MRGSFVPTTFLVAGGGGPEAAATPLPGVVVDSSRVERRPPSPLRRSPILFAVREETRFRTALTGADSGSFGPAACGPTGCSTSAFTTFVDVASATRRSTFTSPGSSLSSFATRAFSAAARRSQGVKMLRHTIAVNRTWKDNTQGPRRGGGFA